MKKVLFVCIHNSARSQMAEAFLNRLCPEFFVAQSAGIEPGVLNPIVVKSMAEAGLDLSAAKTKSVFDILQRGEQFAYVVTVCDQASAERCPVFPGAAERLHWGFPDPSALTGTHEEKLQRVGEIRDAIQRQVQQWCDTVCQSHPVA